MNYSIYQTIILSWPKNARLDWELGAQYLWDDAHILDELRKKIENINARMAWVYLDSSPDDASAPQPDYTPWPNVGATRIGGYNVLFTAHDTTFMEQVLGPIIGRRRGVLSVIGIDLAYNIKE